MLRISVLNDLNLTRFKLEGKLAHEWVPVAEKAWSTQLSILPSSQVVVDLNDVSFVDDPGRELLAQLHSAGAKLVGSGPLISALIDEITDNGSNDRRLGKWTRGTFGLLLFLLFATLAFGQEPLPDAALEVLTLQKAVSAALAHNEQLHIASLEIEEIAKSKRLPQITTYLFGSQLLTPISFTVDAGAFGKYPATRFK